MQRLSRVLAASVLAIGASVLAHGDWPAKHGGLMNDGGETSFELVVSELSVVLHVEDHGDPVDTAGAKGLFSVVRGGETWRSDITPSGGNRLQTVLPRALEPGDKVLARVTMGNGSIAAGRFLIK